jgi:hypothetical protein
MKYDPNNLFRVNQKIAQSEALDLLSLKAGRNDPHFHLLTCRFLDADGRSLWI